MAKAFDKQRFNHFVYGYALIVHYLEDIRSFLDKFEHVTNNLACIIHSFIDIDGLFLMALSAALIGQHLIQPFLSMTYYDALLFEKLIPASQQLYTDLLKTEPQDLLNLDKPAFHI